MRWVLVPVILVPLGALASVDCGILQFPVTGPEALIANSQLIQIQFDIVDQDGNPLDDVTVHATGYALNGNPIAFNGLSTEEKNLGTQKASRGKFEYKSLGNAAVILAFSKAGYQGTEGTYANSDSVAEPDNFLYPEPRSRSCTNVKKNPTQRVVLTKLAR